MLKLVAKEAYPHRIIGVHIFGDDACELIHYGTTLVQGKKTLAECMSVTYAAVTFHELFKLAAANALSTLEEKTWRKVYGIIFSEETEEKVEPELAEERLIAAGANPKIA